MTVVLLWVLAFVLILVGLIGTLLPVMPGALLVFLGMFAGAWADDFSRVGWAVLGVLAILTVLFYVLDFLAGAYGARRLGASRWGVVGAILGALVGMFFGFIGVVVGPSSARSLGSCWPAGACSKRAELALVPGSAWC